MVLRTRSRNVPVTVVSSDAVSAPTPSSDTSALTAPVRRRAAVIVNPTKFDDVARVRRRVTEFLAALPE